MTDKNFKLLQYELLRFVENGVSYYRNFDCFNYEHETRLFDSRNSLVIKHLRNEKISIFWLRDQVDLFEYVVKCNHISECIQHINDYYSGNIHADFSKCMSNNVRDTIKVFVRKKIDVYKLYTNFCRFRNSIYLNSIRVNVPDIVLVIGDEIIRIDNNKTGFSKLIQTSSVDIFSELTKYIKELFEHEGIEIDYIKRSK